MRLFSSPRDDATPEPEDIILLWQYEVSEDGGKSWCSEDEWNDSGAYVLRRGNWVAPPVN
jgi:hypothetical protein